MKPRRMAVLGLTAGLLGGGAAGLVLTGPSLAGAQVSASDPSVGTSDPSAGTSDPSAGTSDRSTGAKRARGEWVRSALAPLVENGTITQEQADAVIAALKDARPLKGHGGKILRGLHRRIDAAATALGMTEAELRDALVSGKSLADIANEKGVDVAKVVDALVAQVKTRLDQQVAAGRKTQAEADQILADARTRIEAFVNGTVPPGGPGKGFGKGHRRSMPAPRARGSAEPSVNSRAAGAVVS